MEKVFTGVLDSLLIMATVALESTPHSETHQAARRSSFSCAQHLQNGINSDSKHVKDYYAYYHNVGPNNTLFVDFLLPR